LEYPCRRALLVGRGVKKGVQVTSAWHICRGVSPGNEAAAERSLKVYGTVPDPDANQLAPTGFCTWGFSVTPFRRKAEDRGPQIGITYIPCNLTYR